MPMRRSSGSPSNGCCRYLHRGWCSPGATASRPSPRAGAAACLAIRFHIHPDIRVSPSQGGGILLKLVNGEGWRFRASGQIAVEESIYLGTGQARKAEQLVISGAVRDSEVQVDWLFEQIGAT